MPELGRGGKQPRRLIAIMQAGAARDVEQRKREHGIGVAALRSFIIPLRGFRIIGGNAESGGIEFSQQRHGMRIALFLGSPHGFLECGEEIAALVGTKGQVRLGRGRGSGFLGGSWRPLRPPRRQRCNESLAGRRARVGLRLGVHAIHRSAPGQERQRGNSNDAIANYNIAGSEPASRAATAAAAATAPRGSVNRASPTATKSAPAAASAVISPNSRA